MKKVLSIVLSLVMVICMMPVMAFAADEATGTTFSDASSIEHSEAVYSLAALNIINGYTDGTYKPAKTVTRAEMCKMIATLLNGGTAPVLSTTTTSYKDTKGHWAAGYIEYCNSLGIVAGVGGGRFSPDATVTAEQAAKMLLIAEGYNADVEGLVGAGWAANTNVLANQNGYYKELTDIATAAGLTREHAAQMIYNVLDAKVVEKSNSVNKVTGEVITIYTPTDVDVAQKYLKLDNASDELTKIEYNENDGVYKYTVGGTPYESAIDYTALFGQNVKVLFKPDPKNTNKTIVYGMYADDSSVVAEAVYGDIDTAKIADKKIKIDGKEYKVEDDFAVATDIIAEYDSTPVEDAAAKDYAKIKAVDNDNNGKIDVIVYSPVTVGEVTFVGKTEFKISGDTDNQKFEDVIAYDGMAKGDYVAITTDLKTGDKVYTKLDTLTSAKVTSTKGDTATINGTAYDMLDAADARVAAGETYDKIGTLNGYIVLVKKDSTKVDMTKYALVSSGCKTVSTYDGDVKTVKLLLTDGKEIEAELAKGTDAPAAGTIVTFTTNSKDKYTLEAVTDKGNFEDYINAGLTFNKKTSDDAANISANGAKYGIDDAAAVYVATTDSDGDVTYSVIKGSDLAAKTDVKSVNQIFTSKNSKTGYENVALALVGDTDVTDTIYAIVTDKASEIKDSDGKFSYELSLSTSDKTLITKTYDTEKTDIKALVKGDVVSYKVNAEGKVTDVVSKTAAMTPGAVTAYDAAAKKITIKDAAAEKEYKMTDDTTILYISNDTAVEGGSIELAEEPSTDNFTNNVKFITVTDKDEIDVLLVDVRNKLGA